MTDENDFDADNKFEFANKTYRSITDAEDFLFATREQSDGLDHSLKTTTSNIEVAKEKDDHHRKVMEMVNDNYLKFTKLRVMELEKRLNEEQRYSKLKDRELDRIRGLNQSIISLIKSGEDGPGKTLMIKKRDAFLITKGSGSSLRDGRFPGLAAKWGNSPDEEIQKLRRLNEYYINKAIKLNDECMKQRNEIEELSEKIECLEKDLIRNSGIVKAWCDNGKDDGGKIDKDCQQRNRNAQSSAGSLRMENKFFSYCRHGDDSMTMVLANEDKRCCRREAIDSLAIERQGFNKKISDELRARFLDKVETTESELIRVREDLKLQRERARKFMIHNELKDHFVACCERMQKELESVNGARCDRDQTKDNSLKEQEIDSKRKHMAEVGKIISFLVSGFPRGYLINSSSQDAIR